MRGCIKSFSPVHGYGFIEADKEYFFHVSQCKDKPIVGDTVLFDLKTTPKGVRAVRVRRECNE